jgi:hypothetical protein
MKPRDFFVPFMELLICKIFIFALFGKIDYIK